MKIEFLADINLLEGDKRLIPYTEKLLGKPGITSAQIKACKALLNDTMLIPYSDEIKEITIPLKQKRKITLPDAMIAATGLQYDLTILTFDKGFPKISGINILLLE